MTPKQREQLMEFCRLAGDWYANNQNTNEHPWGGVANSADHGRFIYEHFPATGKCRGNGVWGQAVGAMGLLALAERLDWAGEPYREAALAAGKYLLSLQVLDQRDERLFGALREHTPQSDWIFPRDGATGCMGLCVLYRETQEEEYLYRARLYADWYIRNAMNEDGWPCHTYRFDQREGEWRQEGAWQAGAGLAFYHLHKLTGEKRYLDEGLRPLMEGYKKLCAETGAAESAGTDDFAALSAMGACLFWDDQELLDCVRRRARAYMEHQDGDGSGPGNAGAFQAGLTWQNFARLADEKNLDVDLEPYRKAIAKAACFAPSIQERDPGDLRAYGGLYGQSTYSVSRTTIHHRSTGYALIFMLRHEGGVDPAGYNVFGW